MADQPTKSPSIRESRKGQSSFVYPIVDILDVFRIIELLEKRALEKPTKYRDLCLFYIGINSGYRASDLIKLTIKDVINLDDKPVLRIIETKTGKPRQVAIHNQEMINVINKWLEYHGNPDPKAPLFVSENRRRNGPMTSIKEKRVYELVKGWCKEIGLPYSYGSHTLRKTYARHKYFTMFVSLEKLQKDLGHESQEETLEYISIMPDEMVKIHKHQIGGNKWWLYFKSRLMKIIR